jgi:hypothetical protein
MKKFLLIVGLSCIAPLAASSPFIEEEIDRVVQISNNDQLSVKERERTVANLLKRVEGDASAVLSLAKRVKSFPIDARFPAYAKQTLAQDIVNTLLPEKSHPNSNFMVIEKEDILQAIEKQMSKSSSFLKVDVISEQEYQIGDLCRYLLSEQGREQLLPRKR